MVALYLELDFEADEPDAVNAVGGPLVRGPRVFGKQLHKSFLFFCGEFYAGGTRYFRDIDGIGRKFRAFEQFRRQFSGRKSRAFKNCLRLGGKFDFELFKAHGLGKTTGGLGHGIGVRQVRLDVYDRRAVHEVGTADRNGGSILPRQVDFLDFDAAHGQGIRPKAAARRKHAQPHIATKTGRAYRRLPGVAHVFRKNPQEPQMTKAFQPTQRIGIPEFRLKDNRRTQILQKPALPRNPELVRKIAPDAGNDLESYLIERLHRTIYRIFYL